MKNWLLLTLAVSLTGCATYHAKPLSNHSTLLDSYKDIVIDRGKMPLPQLAAHPFNPQDGLDMDDIAMLAVVNNPDLKAARDDARIGHAQAFAAGLLPDPQINFTRDFPQNPQPGSTSAFNLNLSEDINALIQQHFNSRAGKYDARKTDLNLLWQEWQVVAKARTLYVKRVEEQRLMTLLQKNRALFADRYRRTKIALDRGLMTLNDVTPHLTALQDVDKQIRDQERQINTDKHDLNALLGLAPEVALPLKGTITLPALDEARVLAWLPELPRRRPDLIALQYGYRAQDWRYRAAIAGQFPTFTVGFTHARDTSGMYTNGFGINLSLPIFNGNRGNIAIEEATRQKLYDDYQNRLNTGYSDVHSILDEQRINERQLRAVNRGLAQLAGAAAKANLAFRMHNIDALAYTNLQASVLSKEIERINLEQSILEQRVALQTVIGGELPVRMY